MERESVIVKLSEASFIRTRERLRTAKVRRLAVTLMILVLAAGTPAAGTPAAGTPAAGTPAAGTPIAGMRDASPLQPASSGGLAALDRALARLSTHKRLLVIAAHPDDEDTALLTWVARGQGGEAAYFSLSRGEGGQNLIGPELGIGLGLLRSRELQAARQIDGARQFFSRAYDFGYTRSVDETLERWPQEILLEDAVRAIRRFKPQVLMAVFPPSERAGHGQHQASAVVAQEAFNLAADADAFPRLLAEGLEPWAIETFYRASWWNPDAATLKLPLGQLEPFSGRSILQIALESRSQHRCQDMGVEQRLGDATGRLTWVAGGGGAEQPDPFAGFDTSLAAIAELLPAGEARQDLAAALRRVDALARSARQRLSATEPTAAVEPLGEIVTLLRASRASLRNAGSVASGHVLDLLEEKLGIAYEALATAAQVLADAIADREWVALGQTLEVRSVFWNAGSFPVEGLDVVAHSSAGWRTLHSEPAEPERGRFATRVTDERRLAIEVPKHSQPTAPYFLRRPLKGSLYDWSETAAAVRGEPFAPPPLSLVFRFRLAGVAVELVREVVHRYRDQALGEVRRPLRAVPALEVSVEPRQLVWSTAKAREEKLKVEIVSNLEEKVRVRLEIDLPPGWPPVLPREVELGDESSRQVIEWPLVPPQDLSPGHYEIALRLVDEAGQRFDHAFPLIDYEHVRPTPIPQAARVVVHVDDIRLPSLGRLGYVRGASDRVPEFLRAVGLPVELLSAADLADRDLSSFDAIVIGSRAYEIDPALVSASPRLLSYTRHGGLLIVQYQQYQFVRGGYAPFPLEIDRPHDRVTDETADVRLLVPEHPVFNVPNRLVAADWEGWVQERGLYFAGTWDDAYQPLLAMSDPGGEEQRGALLVAGLGEGHYVYTGLAFFRQLPAGVTGAYRLFANLLTLGQSAESSQTRKHEIATP